MDKCVQGNIQFSQDKVKVVMYFVEAHTLGDKVPSGQDGKTFYNVLCSVLNSI